MKKVLIVSYAFPPNQGIGNVRAGKFTKYLPEFGWEPVVLTAKIRQDVPQTLPVEINEANIIRTPYFYLNPVLNYRHHRSRGDTAVSKLPETASRGRSFSNLLRPVARLATNLMAQLPILGNIFFEPTGWYFYAVREGLKLLKNNDIKVIFSSSQPRTSHLIAARLFKKTKIPWVAEYRDPWVDPYRNKSQFYQLLETKWGKKVMKGCEILVTVSEFTVARLKAVHSKKIAVIHNGFDEQDYSENVPLTSKFTLTSTGSISSGKRSPELVFQAIAQLQEEGRISSNNFEVRLYGEGLLKTLLPVIEEYHLKDLVKVYGFVPFNESIRRQQESTALLLLEWNSPLAKHVYPGKIFEYLGAGRPVLALAYKTGAIDKLLRETGAGIVVNEVEAIKGVLTRWLEEWQQSGRITSHWNPDINVIKRYTRREGARKLAQLLDEASACTYQ